VEAGMPYTLPSEPIGVSNASRVEMLAHWGAGGINDLALSPDSKTLAAANQLGISFYTADTLQPQGTYPSTKSVNAVAFSPNGLTLAAGSNDGVTLWDLATGKARAVEPPEETESITSLAYSPDGKWLASGTEYGAKLLDPLTAAIWGTFLDPDNIFRSKGVAFSPDSSTLATGQYRYDNNHGPVLLWDLTTWQIKDRYYEDGQTSMYKSTVSGPGGLAYSADGKKLVFPTTNYSVALWDPAGGDPLEAKAPQ
jgi:WD40 repeat protein